MEDLGSDRRSGPDIGLCNGASSLLRRPGAVPHGIRRSALARSRAGFGSRAQSARTYCFPERTYGSAYTADPYERFGEEASGFARE